MTEGSFDIESAANPRVRGWVSLSKRSVRDETGTFLIEGARETERALRTLAVKEVVWCPQYGAAPDAGTVSVTTVSVRVFDRISRRQNPDGVAAVGTIPDISIDSFTPTNPPLVLVGDATEKPGNIGAMLRSCDAFGAGFLGSSLGTDLANPNVIRAAQGSIFATPLASAVREEAITWATGNTQIVVAHPAGASPLWDRDLTGPTTIVIGSEHAGVHSRWLDVGSAASIPMAGLADSLNASVTAGVYLAEAARQRSG
jgi:TrmH family RNA methyltransferase